MWYSSYLMGIINSFLPPFAEFIILEAPFKRPAVGMIDLDGDGVLELIGAYNWQGENYIIILKYCYGTWQVASIRSDLSIYEWIYMGLKDLIDDNQYYSMIEICEYDPFMNQYGIDFSSIKYICSETKPDVKLEEAIKKEYDLKLYDKNIRYYYNRVDLNDDGIPEVFAFLVGSFICGTGGCSAVIFKLENGEYKLLSRFSLVRNPVIISNTKTNGYRDIIMNGYGGGIQSFFALIKYDGTTYPSNPSVQPKVEPGTKVDGIAIVADDIAKNSGIKLEGFNN